MAKTKKTEPVPAPEPAAPATEDQQPAQTESNPLPEQYDYEISSTFQNYHQGNNRDQALKALEDVKKQGVEKFSFTDRLTGVKWLYEKESYQKNYRVMPSDEPPATPVV